MLQPPVTDVSCELRCVRAARCVAASESRRANERREVSAVVALGPPQ
eukprot:COSAG04_NODE_267_length_18528_cov_60.607141_8_plen_47_part_00